MAVEAQTRLREMKSKLRDFVFYLEDFINMSGFFPHHDTRFRVVWIQDPEEYAFHQEVVAYGVALLTVNKVGTKFVRFKVSGDIGGVIIASKVFHFRLRWDEVEKFIESRRGEDDE